MNLLQPLKPWADELKRSEAFRDVFESWVEEIIRSEDPEPENWWLNFFGIRWRRPESFIYKFWYLVRFYPPEGFNIYLRSLIQNEIIQDLFPARDYQELFSSEYSSRTIYNNEFANMSPDNVGELVGRIASETFNTLSSLVRVIKVPQQSFSIETGSTLSSAQVKYPYGIKHNQLGDSGSIKVSFVNAIDTDPPLVLPITPNDLFRIWLDYASGLPSSEDAFSARVKKVNGLANNKDLSEILAQYGDQLGQGLLPLDLLWVFRVFVLRPFKLKTDYRSLWEKMTNTHDGKFGVGDLTQNIKEAASDIVKETAENLLGGVGMFSKVKKLKERPLDLIYNVYDIVGIPVGVSGMEFDYSEEAQTALSVSEIDVSVLYSRRLSKFRFLPK